MATIISPTRPEWADAKSIGHIFGICKSTLYRLADDGKIKSSSLRERGKLRGKRLFSCDSIANYIDRLAVGGETTPTECAAVSAARREPAMLSRKGGA